MFRGCVICSTLMIEQCVYTCVSHLCFILGQTHVCNIHVFFLGHLRTPWTHVHKHHTIYVEVLCHLLDINARTMNIHMCFSFLLYSGSYTCLQYSSLLPGSLKDFMIWTHTPKQVIHTCNFTTGVQETFCKQKY